MSTLARDQSQASTQAPRPLLWLLWLIPLHGLLLVWGTWERQPTPSTEFAEWSRFVTTDNFLWSHVIASIGGQTAAIVAAAALAALLLLRGAPTGRTVTGLVMHLVGSGLLLAGFGTAAFAQPAIGELHASDPGLAEIVYGAVYSPLAIALLLLGAALFGLSTLWTGSALTSLPEVPNLAGRLYAAAGPTFAVVGFFIGPVQTLGALLFVVSGVLVARALSAPGPGRTALQS
jgi:hypothetical protein